LSIVGTGEEDKMVVVNIIMFPQLFDNPLCPCSPFTGLHRFERLFIRFDDAFGFSNPYFAERINMPFGLRPSAYAIIF